MSKAEIQLSQRSAEECRELLRQYSVDLPAGSAPLYLFGGYSGSNYRVEGTDGKPAVLKFCNSYTAEEVEGQARVMALIRDGGFAGACTVVPRAGRPKDGFAYTTSSADGVSCLLLSWVEGQAADKVIASKAVGVETVMRSVGEGLGKLHTVDVSGAVGIRSFTEGGACDVRKHVSGEYEAAINGSPLVAGHDFLPFYAKRVAELRTAITQEGLPQGVLHGDPFLDNILIEPTTGALGGFVDFEDGCLGPLLFDTACCAAAACFREDGALDIRRLRALMQGYASARPLLPTENKCFISFMQLAMLCNCSWRFKQFNIDRREIEGCRDAHRELQDRIDALEDDTNVAAIEAVLSKLPQPQPPPPAGMAKPSSPPPAPVPSPAPPRSSLTTSGVLLAAAAAAAAAVAVAVAVAYRRARLSA